MANLDPGQHQEAGRRLRFGQRVPGPGTSDGFQEGRSSRLLKGNVFTLRLRVLLGKALGSADEKAKGKLMREDSGREVVRAGEVRVTIEGVCVT